MKKTYESISNALKCTGRSILLLALLLGFASCNSRPDYCVEVYDVTSTCASDATLRITQNTDPDVLGAAVETSNVPASTYCNEQGLLLAFDSGITCLFRRSYDNADCYTDKAYTQTASCTASRRLVELREPTHSQPEAADRVILGQLAKGC